MLVNPGEIIAIQNPHESGETLSGRLANSTSSTATLDREIDFNSTIDYDLMTVRSDGTLQTNRLARTSGSKNQVTLLEPFTEIPAPQTPWIISKPSLVPELFQVVRVSENEDKTFTIEAVNYDPSKYSFIERSQPLVERPVSSIVQLLEAPLTPIDLEVSESLLTDLNSTVFVKTQLVWGVPVNSRATSYRVEYRTNGGDWIFAGTALSTSFDLRDLPQNSYEFRVCSVSATGKYSDFAYRSTQLNGLSEPPASVGGLSISALQNQVRLTWNLSSDLDVKFGGQVKIRHSPKLVGASWSSSIEVGSQPGSSTSAILPLLDGTYLVKFADSGGRESQNATMISTAGLALAQRNIIASMVENPSFLGVKQNCLMEDNLLKMIQASDFVAASGTFTQAPGLFTELNRDLIGVIPQASYQFATVFDAGKITNARIGGELEIFSQFGNESFTLRKGTFLDQVGYFAGGDDSSQGSARIQVATSIDGVSYTNWRDLQIGEFHFRYAKFRLQMESYSLTARIVVSQLKTYVDVEDREQRGQLTIPYTTNLNGTRVNFPETFFGIPEVQPIITPLFDGETVSVSSIDKLGFNVKVNYSTQVPASARTLTWFAKSY
ncbi:hypothetical protein LEP3755_34270 [Leptolyngbya sp. NIES-3755]|nr:hypothetical protein LEP3755_34270 [Leptolyngbya sp. NIES-3755]